MAIRLRDGRHDRLPRIVAAAACCLAIVVASLPAVAAAQPPRSKGAAKGAAAEPASQAAKGPPVYQPAGAPADPQVEARWNRFHDYAQATRLLEQLAAAHPEHFRLQSLGKSYGGREMWLVTLTEFGRGKELEKPAFWIDGGIHANEIQSVEVVLYTAWYLAEMRGRSDVVTRLLRERVFYLMPMLSPDSRDAHMYRPNTTHTPRGGQRPVDDDRDGQVDEDGPDDLDGDGHIARMRIRDPNGRHVAHPDFPQLMIAAKPDQKGTYTLLGSEGIDNDGDGRVNEDGDGYYDPNRDWAWNWQPASVQRGAHHYPFSVPENRMAAEFAMAHPNIAGAQSYHNTGGMLLRGPGAKNDRVPAADLKVYDQLGKQGEAMLPGYRYLETSTELYEAHGTAFDWFFGMRGVFAFTNELNTPFNLFREADGAHILPVPEAAHRFDKYLLLGDGIIPWHEVDHPQFGKVEVGGTRKSWSRQPASFLLEEECHRNMAFTLYHADAMPRVRVDAIETEPLPGGLTQVTATIVNRKLIPTHARHDIDKKITPPDRITISGPHVLPLAAFTSNRKVFDRPSEQRRDPREVRVPNIPSFAPVYVRWIVQGEGPYTVQVRSIKGGVHARRSEGGRGGAKEERGAKERSGARDQGGATGRRGRAPQQERPPARRPAVERKEQP